MLLWMWFDSCGGHLDRAFGTIKHSCKTSPSLCSHNTCKTSCPILTPYPSCTIKPCIHSKWSMVRGTLVDRLCFLACDFSHPTMRVFFIVPHWSSIRSLWLLLLCSAACIAWFPESSSIQLRSLEPSDAIHPGPKTPSILFVIILHRCTS
jgi:hypothetical protein